ISINGAPPGPVLGYYMGISPGWIAAMKVPLIRGRDFREGDTSPGTAIVSEAFAKQFFPGEDPIGRTFARGNGGPDHIVGVVGDVPYESMRGPTLPVAYVPLHGVDTKGVAQPLRQGAFVVRTSAAKPLGMATTLRREVARAHPGFRVSNVRTQIELVEAQTIRERLLAALALFFAAVALLLANVGLYGILEYTIAQRRREIGIRIALGAGTGDVARRVTMDVLAMVVLGAAAGMALAVPSARYVQTLLYQVKAEDPAMLALPSLAILAAALLAAVPAVIHAMQIEPVEMLRAE
ncbi:MAG TPA: FtsX-like permease family protein, partial [Bryobacteraceae bacterium]|nr:FtsX-like permease family protein [Bryobacteraceae bacterium]